MKLYNLLFESDDASPSSEKVNGMIEDIMFIFYNIKDNINYKKLYKNLQDMKKSSTLKTKNHKIKKIDSLHISSLNLINNYLIPRLIKLFGEDFEDKYIDMIFDTYQKLDDISELCKSHSFAGDQFTDTRGILNKIQDLHNDPEGLYAFVEDYSKENCKGNIFSCVDILNSLINIVHEKRLTGSEKSSLSKSINHVNIKLNNLKKPSYDEDGNKIIKKFFNLK